MPKVETLNDTIFIIFGCTRDAARFIEQYPNFKEINYGGIAKKEGSKSYGDVVYLNEEEREDTKKIMSCGTSVFMQQLPTTKREELKL